MRRLILAVLLLLPFAPTAEAITIRDIIELSKAGLGDDVMLALIEVDGGVFNIDTATLTRLKTAGVSERVIVAMVRSGRTRPVEEPQPVSITTTDPAPEPIVEQVIREVAVPVPVAVPVYIPVPVRSRSHVVDPRLMDPRLQQQLFPGARFQVGGPKLTDTPPQPTPRQPVYWGWGGKLRPDAWKPDRQQ